jgi:hypothetical protein
MPTLLEQGYTRGLVAAAERGLTGRSAEIFAEEFSEGWAEGFRKENTRLCTILLNPKVAGRWLQALKIATEHPTLSDAMVIELLYAADGPTQTAPSTGSIAKRAAEPILTFHAPPGADQTTLNSIADAVYGQFGFKPTFN